jgi:hypothetical protein
LLLNKNLSLLVLDDWLSIGKSAAMFCLLLRICLLNSTINEKRTRNPSPNKTRAKTTVRTIASSSAVSSRGVYTHTHTLSLFRSFVRWENESLREEAQGRWERESFLHYFRHPVCFKIMRISSHVFSYKTPN